MSAKIRMLPDNWTYEDYYLFVKAFQTGNTEETFRLALQLIASWDYDVPLNQPDAIMRLGVAESADVIRTVMENIGAYLEDLKTDDVKVSFDKWDTGRFMHFDQLRRDGKIRQVVAMLPEVITWDRLNVSEPVSMTVGATCLKAINEAYKRLVTGKN